MRITGAAGHGKLQPYDEPILTPYGYTEMRNIKKGSFVINKYGKQIKVLETFKGENLEIYKLTFSDGSTTRCCIDHLWEVQTKKQIEKNKYSVFSLKEILPNINKTKNIKSNYYYSVDLVEPIEFKTSDLFLHPYLMGLLIGNGYFPINRGYTLTMNSDRIQETFDLIKNIVPFDVIVKLSELKKKNTNTGVITFNVGLRKYLDHYLLLGVKSKEKFIPHSYLYNSIENRIELLKGLMDSDGSIIDFKTKMKLSYSTISNVLANDFLNLARSLGSYAVLREFYRKDKGIEYNISLRTKFNPFKISNRKDVFEKHKFYYKFKKKIISANFIGYMDGQCLLVDDDRHLYVTNDYTVTHNTTMIKTAFNDFKKEFPKSNDIIGITVSHKAKNVLARSIPNVTTFASAYGYKEKILSNGAKTFEPNLYKIKDAICKYDNLCFVIDECSMFSQEMLDIVFNETNIFTKIIFVGDKNQLPPILSIKDNNKDSPVFYWNLPEELSQELTEVVRQEADNPIVFVANEIAKEIQDNCNIQKIMNLLKTENVINDKGIHLLDKFTFPFHYIKHHKNDLLNNKIIGYRNAIIDSHNNTLRNLIYNYPNNKFIEGEVIFFNETYFNESEGVVIQNSSEFIIEKILNNKISDVDSYMIYITDEDGNKKRFPIPSDKGQITYETICDMYYSDKKFNKYWKFKSLFANISSSFAITSYKSQGSTYNNVYIDIDDMLSEHIPISPKRRLQSLYTALTRAKFNVYILK